MTRIEQAWPDNNVFTEPTCTALIAQQLLWGVRTGIIRPQTREKRCSEADWKKNCLKQVFQGTQRAVPLGASILIALGLIAWFTPITLAWKAWRYQRR